MKESRCSEIDWPETELEHIGHCPVCGSTSRKLLHNGLIDNVSFCAPGKWNMQQCLNCSAAYLDPRPSPTSLHLAYQTYHTHSGINEHPTMPKSFLHRIRRALANGYRNWRYGAQSFPSIKLGIVAAYLLPNIRRRLDMPLRHLPRVWVGARVLDVGFGNGEFLKDALAIGWEVAGVDMDTVVVNNAKSHGLNVRQGNIEVYADQPESFDVITISHVIEHVYDPVETLRVAFKLLKPGGQLWLDTPNMDSFGHARFGAHWRGLEAPRHLVLFGHESMNYVLSQAGFRVLKIVDRTADTQEMFRISERIRSGMGQKDDTYSRLDWPSWRDYIAVKLLKNRAEFITLIANKPAVV